MLRKHLTERAKPDIIIDENADWRPFFPAGLARSLARFAVPFLFLEPVAKRVFTHDVATSDLFGGEVARRDESAHGIERQPKERSRFGQVQKLFVLHCVTSR